MPRDAAESLGPRAEPRLGLSDGPTAASDGRPRETESLDAAVGWFMAISHDISFQGYGSLKSAFGKGVGPVRSVFSETCRETRGSPRVPVLRIDVRPPGRMARTPGLGRS